MLSPKNNSKLSKLNFIRLAFEQAKINLGSTGNNPSVGCVVEKNGAVISAACTSINGRPHAESNALSKNYDFKNSNIYVSLEPCSHYGNTPPCTNIIIKKANDIGIINAAMFPDIWPDDKDEPTIRIIPEIAKIIETSVIFEIFSFKNK